MTSSVCVCVTACVPKYTSHHNKARLLLFPRARDVTSWHINHWPQGQLLGHITPLTNMSGAAAIFNPIEPLIKNSITSPDWNVTFLPRDLGVQTCSVCGVCAFARVPITFAIFGCIYEISHGLLHLCIFFFVGQQLHGILYHLSSLRERERERERGRRCTAGS